MPFLGLLWGASGLTSLGKYLAIGFAGLLAMGFVVNSITAPYKRQVKALENHNRELALASEQKDAQIEQDRARAEDDHLKQQAFDAEIQRVLANATDRSTDCRLSAERLRLLRGLAAR
jgi:hypothetical protein